MKAIIHHPDGVVYVYNGGKRYVESVAHFSADAMAAGIENPLSERPGFWHYDMPDGFCAMSAVGQHGPVQQQRWLAGENAIKAVDELLKTKAVRATGAT